MRDFSKRTATLEKYQIGIFKFIYFSEILYQRGSVMVFNATFNNICIIFWRSVLLVKKTTDMSQVTDKLYST